LKKGKNYSFGCPETEDPKIAIQKDLRNMERLCEYRIYKIQSAYIQGTERGHRPASREATIRLS
jgi:hypothetical protein